MDGNKEYKRLNGVKIDEKDLKERLFDIENIVVHHKRFTDLYDMIRDCHHLNDRLVILGDTGAGKSTLFKTYELAYPRQKKTRIRNGHTIRYESVPVLRVELAANSSPLNVASKMLESLGEPFYNKGSEKVLTGMLKHQMEDSEVGVVFIDEAQHIVASDTQKVIYKAADWIKQFDNDVKIPIVFGGIKEKAKRIFAANEQLDERFPNKQEFNVFPYSNPDEQKEFRGYLKGIEAKLPFADRSSSKIFDPYLAGKIYYASLGTPRTIYHLLRHASSKALKDGSDMLEEKHLFEGFDLLSFVTRPKVINPFDEKVFNLNVAMEKENLKKP
ncbi:AAA family ATPase [Paenibacillus sp. LMG 31461]|uniref:AAA family ATPase n=1 Tax=Paenibacillus plantarum TaxID=2654975 RepID=A0ABX1X6R1_9BACL|nr:TniB family NTP-binding protein [Paenibacillus plantarum]NOU64094.1 AAA family ATPase [Paenibacillus plantarum]